MAWTPALPPCSGVTGRGQLLAVCLLNDTRLPFLNKHQVRSSRTSEVSQATNHVDFLESMPLTTDQSGDDVSVMVYLGTFTCLMLSPVCVSLQYQ